MMILLISSAVGIASFVGTLAGFGTSALLIPVIVTAFDPPTALLFVGIIHFISNAWKIAFFWEGLDLRYLVLFGVSGIIGALIGGYIPHLFSSAVFSRIIGIFLLLYGTTVIAHATIPISPRREVLIAGGFIAGFFAGLTGISGSIRSAFLTMVAINRVTFVATSAAIGLMVDITRLPIYLMSGARLDDVLIKSLILSVPISFLAVALGKKVVLSVSQQEFRTLVAAALCVFSLKLIFLPS